MPCKILIRAQLAGPWQIGFPVLVVEDDHEFGIREALPEFVVIRITDATKDQVIHFIKKWKTNFTHEILAENVSGYRIKISVHPRVVSVFGQNQGLKTAIKLELVGNWGAVIFDAALDQQYVTIDIPKPVNLQALKVDILDKFEQDLDVCINYFTVADVDLVIAAGGYMEMNKAQALAKLKNRLVD